MSPLQGWVTVMVNATALLPTRCSVSCSPRRPAGSWCPPHSSGEGTETGRPATCSRSRSPGAQPQVAWRQSCHQLLPFLPRHQAAGPLLASGLTAPATPVGEVAGGESRRWCLSGAWPFLGPAACVPQGPIPVTFLRVPGPQDKACPSGGQGKGFRRTGATRGLRYKQGPGGQGNTGPLHPLLGQLDPPCPLDPLGTWGFHASD